MALDTVASALALPFRELRDHGSPALSGARGFGEHMWGVDIDSDMIEYCRKQFAKENFSFVQSPHQSATYLSRRARNPLDKPALRIADADSKDFTLFPPS